MIASTQRLGGSWHRDARSLRFAGRERLGLGGLIRRLDATSSDRLASRALARHRCWLYLFDRIPRVAEFELMADFLCELIRRVAEFELTRGVGQQY